MEVSKTPLLFQKDLAREVERIAADMLFQVPPGRKKGDELASLRAYCQNLPIQRREETDGDSPGGDSIDYVDREEEPVFKCPWSVIKIDGGKMEREDARQAVKVAVCFGIYNSSEENKGHEEILNLIQRVYERFAKEPLLERQYVCQGDFEWALQDEDTYPYFFGAISMTFTFSGFRRENRFI